MKITKRSKLEYFPWYAAKYAADTTHLSEPADAAYRRIMDHIFMHDQVSCRVALDDDLLIGISRRPAEEWPRIRRALIDGPAPMFAKEDDADGSWIYSPFLRSVIKEAKKKTRQSRDAANERWERERIARAMRTHSSRNEREKKKVKREKKQPTEPSVPPVGERDISTTGGRVRAIEARASEVARWLTDHPTALQCLDCVPHAPHAARHCGEERRDQTPCDCDAESGTRLSPAAAAEFASRFQETWVAWCERRDTLARSAA